ncbi:MAG: hypothetical protein RR977_01590 [Oscillospiraceae bacterium]
MRIEPENTGNVLVFLSKEDFNNFQLSYERLDAQDAHTRHMTAEILSRIWEATGIDFKKRRLLIEAYPNGDGSILRIGAVIREKIRVKKKYRELFRNPMAFAFTDQETLLSAASMFRHQFFGDIRRSALYRTEHGYRLLLYFVLSKNQPSFLENECKYYTGQGILQEAYAIEYGKPIVLSNALELLTAES